MRFWCLKVDYEIMVLSDDVEDNDNTSLIIGDDRNFTNQTS